MKLEQVQKVKDILMDKLDNLDCDTCRSDGHSPSSKCHDCHRIFQNWQISKEYSEELAKEIVSSICEVDE